MKKIISTLICAAMLAAMVCMLPVGAAAAWDGSASAAFTGSGTTADPYIIASAENLKYLQLQVAEGKDYEGKYFTQTADIDLAGKEWTPIGDSGLYFSGIYDGLGHSVNGLFISNGTLGYTGLFGYITSGYKHEAGIMNLKLYGEINIPDLQKDNGIGALVGSLYKDGTDGYLPQKVMNIENHVNITIKANDKQPRLGAVIGYSFNSEVTNVVNYGTITYEGSGNTRIGGIVGQTNRTHFLNCINNGDITVTTTGSCSAQAAGISGMTTFKVDGIYTDYDHCVNNANITCVSDTGACFGGGIVAAIYTSGTNLYCVIHDCVNNGAVSSTMNSPDVTEKYAYAAGIIPRIAISTTELENCVNTSMNIYSSGVTGEFAGGIVGEITKDDAATITVRNCTTVTPSIVVKSPFEVAGEFSALDSTVNAAVSKIMEAIPDAAADAKIDGFPGKVEETKAPETKPAEPETTEAPETEPETAAATEADVTEAVVTDAPATEAPAGEKKGCGSSAAVCAVMIAALTGAVLVRRKHN